MTAYEHRDDGDEADSTPRDPAGPRKRGAAKPPPDKPVSATRQGNQDKFAWFYAMLADPEVSLKGKAVGAGCVMKMAGHKGHFKATRKAIANLCGTSIATVRRALDDLIDKRYLNVEYGEGSNAANTYHLIFPVQRCEEWLEAETEYKRETHRAEWKIRNWLFAESKWLNEQKEKQFRVAVFDASTARGADAGRAQRITDHLVRKFRENERELDVEGGLASIAKAPDDVFVDAAPAAENPPSGDPEPDQKRADPGSALSRPRLNGEPTPAQRRADPGSALSRPRLTPEATSSADDQTHKSLKDSERPVKVFQDLESEPALRDALARARRPVRQNAGACELCGPDGMFRDAEGFPVVLLADDPKSVDGYIEYPVECQHSMAGNLAEIQRREEEADPKDNLGLCITGWPDIDSHYPQFRDL